MHDSSTRLVGLELRAQLLSSIRAWAQEGSHDYGVIPMSMVEQVISAWPFKEEDTRLNVTESAVLAANVVDALATLAAHLEQQGFCSPVESALAMLAQHSPTTLAGGR